MAITDTSISTDLQAAAAVGRVRWTVRGQVQGVGFRPFVYRLAGRLHLSGFVKNSTKGVVIEAQGPSADLEVFERELRERRPTMAVIDELRRKELDVKTPAEAKGRFEILPSDADGQTLATITVDTATCDECVKELLQPRRMQRRGDHPMITCTTCGPRFSILRTVPYDRSNTTMAGFEMCRDCAQEYLDPADRRFDAQTISCPSCGPKVMLTGSNGSPIPGDAIDGAVRLLMAGKIVAIKGIGGFHLAVRANDDGAVERLRRLKKRDHKPLALMCGSLESAQQLARFGAKGIAALTSPARPIVLGIKTSNASLLPRVAPGVARLGMMLAYTPVHHLLFARGGDSLGPLVMTSGNCGDEPIATDNLEAIHRLGGLCDAFLLHDRPIERSVEDSVLLDQAESDPLPLRRSRGYAPAPIALPWADSTPGLCVGADLKSAVAVVRDGTAILSQHLGDLTHPLAYEHFRKAIDDLRNLFGVEPRWIAADLHPQYLSTQYARQLAKSLRVPLVAVQHHLAHAAALMAEHGRRDPILAIVCDGVGYGLDGQTWGGELLAAGLGKLRRVGHLRPMLLPGGDAAARDTRRCGLGLLHMAYGDDFADLPATRRLVSDEAERAMLCAMIVNRVNCVESSAAGRMFDGVAALLGVCEHNHYEAQSGMELEAVCEGTATPRNMASMFEIRGRGTLELDFSPLVRDLIEGTERGRDAGESSAIFHEQLALGWDRMAATASRRTGLRMVGLSGGVFGNQRLGDALTKHLKHQRLRVLRHRTVPSNDGGIALGQAAIAAARAALEGGRTLHHDGLLAGGVKTLDLGEC